MKRVMYLVFTLLLLTVSYSKAEEDEAVITLTTSNFDDIVNNAEIILVEFYAPWCGHCKHLAPEFEKAAQVLKGATPPILLAKVDATVETELGERFSIRGYPTLKVFRNGKDFEYGGPRQADGIVSYMEKQAGPASRPLKSASELESFRKKSQAGAVVVAYFSDAKSPQLAKFRQIANTLRDDFLFAEVTDSSLVKSSGYTNQVVVERSDGKNKVWDGSSDLAEFINTNSISVGGEFTQENAKRYTAAGLPVLKAFIPVDWAKNIKRTQYYQRRLQKLGEEFENKVLFALANKESFLRDPSSYGVTDAAAEFIVAIEEGAKKYVYPASLAFTVENLRKFVGDFLAKKLTAYIKSEAVPTEQGPVTTVVGSNFDDIVLDESKNVMIEFYAPWCGHCKTLAPTYEELGKKFADDDSVVIAKIDATTNDWAKDKFEVQGFPTIFFKPAGKGSKIVSYNGNRDLKDLEKFVRTNSVKA